MRVMKTVGKELKRKGVTMKRYYDNFPLCCPRARRCSPASTRTTIRCSRTRRPTAATASSTSCTATTTCRCGCRRPATGPPTSASTRTATPSPTSTAPCPATCRGAGTTGTCSRRRAPSTSTTRSTRTATLRQYTSAEEDYSTDVFTKKAKRFIRAQRARPRPRSTSSSATRPRTAAAAATPGRSCNRAAVPAPRDLGTLKEKFEGHAAAVVQRGRRLRQAVAGRREAAADRRADLRHAAQAPLRLGVAARRRRQRRRAARRAPARRHPQEHLRLLPLRQRLPARRAPDPRQQALPLRGVGAGPVHRPRPGDPARRELRRHGRQRRPDLDHPGARRRQPRARRRTASR